MAEVEMRRGGWAIPTLSMTESQESSVGTNSEFYLNRVVKLSASELFIQSTCIALYYRDSKEQYKFGYSRPQTKAAA